jgi:hypothetical protein
MKKGTASGKGACLRLGYRRTGLPQGESKGRRGASATGIDFERLVVIEQYFLETGKTICYDFLNFWMAPLPRLPEGITVCSLPPIVE